MSVVPRVSASQRIASRRRSRASSERRHGGRSPEGRHERVDDVRRDVDRARLEQPLQPRGEPERRYRRAAQVLHHRVVPAPPTSVLPGAELVVRPGNLEEGPRVVVEPPDQARLDRVRRSQRVEVRAERVEVRPVSLVEEILDHGRFGHGGAIPLVFRIEDPERVRVEPALRVRRQRRRPRGEKLDERGPVAPARLGAADRVDEDPQVGDAEVDEKPHQEIDDLGVAARSLVPENLGSELVELPVAPTLRALRTEHGPRVPPPRQRFFGPHVVLDERPRGARRPLGPQRERFTVVIDRVHLLLDDVGRLPDGADEERRRLDAGRADLPEAVQAHRAREEALDAVPATDVVGQHVVHAFDGAERGHGRGDMGDGEGRNL